MKIISLINQKGGVGKTTTAFQLSYELSKRGYKCLAIDFDPQSNLTTLALGNVQFKEYDTTINQLLRSSMGMLEIDDNGVPKVSKEEIKENYLKSKISSKWGFDILGANLNLARVSMEMENASAREMILKRILDAIKELNLYDLVLIDCPPTLGILMTNAMAASDYILIPTEMEYHSAKGVQEILKNIISTKSYINPKLEVGGIILTKYRQGTKLTAEVHEMIKSSYGLVLRTFDRVIPQTQAIGKASLESLPISVYIEKNKHDKAGENAMNAYKELTDEIVSTLNL